jgi:hypothetical protein
MREGEWKRTQQNTRHVSLMKEQEKSKELESKSEMRDNFPLIQRLR